MADQSPASPENDTNGMDYAEHEKTYALFIGLAKWALIVSVLILVMLGWMTL